MFVFAETFRLQDFALLLRPTQCVFRAQLRRGFLRASGSRCKSNSKLALRTCLLKFLNAGYGEILVFMRFLENGVRFECSLKTLKVTLLLRRLQHMHKRMRRQHRVTGNIISRSVSRSMPSRNNSTTNMLLSIYVALYVYSTPLILPFDCLQS